MDTASLTRRENTDIMKQNDEKNGIFRAVHADVPLIRAMMDEAVRNLPDRAWYIDDPPSYIEKHIEEEGYILKYICEGTPAGFLMVRRPCLSEDNLGYYLQYSEKMLRAVSHIESTVVLREFQGRGIFSALLERAVGIENESKKDGRRYILATAHPDNHYSSHILEKHLFSPAGIIEQYHSYRRVLYERIL